MFSFGTGFFVGVRAGLNQPDTGRVRIRKRHSMRLFIGIIALNVLKFI